ncbi:hypothetical protein ANN_03449 [Periplaneta americana]|uniref:Uncharacterized protein n=1 Tax=Periplaneta americana TaxID=6978 RepID=A0ABQ8U4K4_PERAM|nr:hypothetical protein ANN_03449 [Periplaneta americana]
MVGLCEDGNEPPGSLKASNFEIINSTVEQLNRGRGKVADAVRAKVDTVLSKTLDMKNYKKVVAVMSGESTDARTCKLVSKSETEVTGGQEGRTQARGTGNMCPGVELTDEGMYGLCLRVVKHTLSVMQDNFSDVMLDIISRAAGEQKGEYSDILKKFAITMHFYSPAAYEYLRQNLNNSLPHVNTLRTWYNTVRGDPGFTQEAFLALEERAKLSSHQIWVVLMFDEMSIKKCIEWNGKEFVGYVDLGDGVCLTETEEAKEINFIYESIGVTKRSTQNLKVCYENLKRRLRKDLADEKVETYKTGGGKKNIKTTNIDPKLLEIMGHSIRSLQNALDSDTSYQGDVLYDGSVSVVTTQYEVPSISTAPEMEPVEQASTVSATVKQDITQRVNVQTPVDMVLPNISQEKEAAHSKTPASSKQYQWNRRRMPQKPKPSCDAVADTFKKRIKVVDQTYSWRAYRPMQKMVLETSVQTNRQ